MCNSLMNKPTYFSFPQKYFNQSTYIYIAHLNHQKAPQFLPISSKATRFFPLSKIQKVFLGYGHPKFNYDPILITHLSLPYCYY